MELLSPKVDFIFKKIFGNEKKPNILISFLNAVMYEGKTRIKSVEMNNTDIEQAYIDDKYSRLDIKATTNQNEVINIEIQRVNKQNMAERTLYYWSKMYASKIVKGEDYRNLPRTVCINVLDYKMPELKDIKQYHSVYQLKHTVSNIALTNKLEIHFIELPKFELCDENSLLEMWLEFIERPAGKRVQSATNRNRDLEEAKEELEMISGNEEERAYYQKREETLLEEISALTGNFYAGKIEGKIEIAKNLLDILDNETIAQKTGLSLEEVMELRGVDQ